MASSPQLPGSHAWRDASGQPLPVEFFKFFRSLLTFIAETEGSTIDLAALTARVDALEAAGVDDIGLVLGAMSVKHYGVLTDGNVTLTLVGDSDAPGNSYYYGTDASGVKGWHALSLDALSDVDLTTVPPTSGDALVFDGTDWVPGAVLSNPMTTPGDMIVGGVAGAPTAVAAGTLNYVWTSNGPGVAPSWQVPSAGSGTVTSVALTAPDIFTVSGSPITGAGTLDFTPVNPGADRLVFWDDSASKWQYLTLGTNLTITGTTLNAAGGGGGSGVWGAITGTITDQTDLMQRLATASLLDCPFL